MLNFNTNLSAFIAQRSFENSTNILNQAIERMSTGLKINGAKDNAANYAITEQMTTQISSLDVAEDNAASGLDLVTTANEQLDIINDRFTRLRDLAIQAENKTYGEESLKAINAECNALVDEIKRIYKNAEYNGIKIYGSEMFETIPTGGTQVQTFGADPQPATSTTTADVNTTLEELGIDYSDFQIYNSSGEIIESYDTEKKDTLGDIFAVLNNYGFTSSITDGVVSISSTNGRYVDGDLMNKLGITLSSEDFISSTEQSSTAKVYYTTTQTATEASTLADLGVLTSGTDTVQVKNKYGDNVTSINVNSNTTLGGLFNSLGNYGIQGSIDEGIISLASSDGNYVVTNGVIASLGIGTAQSSSLVTTGTTQTSADVVTYESVTVTGGEVTTIQEERTTTVWTTTTTSETHTNTIWTTETTTEEQTVTIWTTTTTSSTVTETIWTTTTSSETQTNTVTITGTQSTTKTGTLYVEDTSAANPSYTDEEVTAMTSIQSVSSFTSGQKYKIETAADLAYLATRVNAGASHSGAIFVLANDIDLSGYSNWTPIGTSSNSFIGIFDGNGHVIENLTINNDDGYNVGLFGVTYSGSEIKNLGLENVNIRSIYAEEVGALVGWSKSRITNCYAQGSITASTQVGGLVGVNHDGGFIKDCYALCTVVVDNACAGGLVGANWSDIINCYAKGDSYATYCNAGGLVACHYEGNITNSYATGNVEAYGDAGGLVGRVASSTTITNSYSTGNVEASDEDEPYGGFIGLAEGDFYFVNCAAVQDDSNATVMTIEQINATYTPESMGFTEANGWSVVNDTPILSWQNSSTTITRDTTLTDIGFSIGEILTLDWSGEIGNGTMTLTEVTSTTSIGNIIDQFNSGMGFYWGNLEGEDNLMSASLVNGVITFITPIGVAFDTTQGLFTKFGSLTTTNTVHTDQVVETNTIKTTTTTSTTQTNTIWETTSTSTTETQTVNVTTSTSTTETETISVTTTSSTTQTEMVDVLVTANASYTTTNISMTADTTFSMLGLTSRAYITVMNDSTRTIITVKTADTVSSIITKLNNAGATTTLADGKLTITPNSKSIYISGMSDNLLDKLAFEGDFYQTSLGVDMTDSNTMVYDGAITIRQNTTLSEIGVTSGVLTVQKDGSNYATISVSENQSVNEFVNELKSLGFNAKCSNGKIEINSDGDMKIVDSDANSSNALSVFALRDVQQTVDSTYSNNDSSQLFMLSELVNTVWQATGSIKLQIGSGTDENSQLEINTGFTMRDLDKLTSIGKNTVNKINYIEEIDSILSEVSSKQTELGAFTNRLESALEEINIRYDNLVSARSTLRDADIAEESAIFVQQQILQQASATLLSVANMSPQLALQLL